MLIEKWLEKYRKHAAKTGATCDVCAKEVFDYPNTRICAVCEKELAFVGTRCPVCGRKTVTEGVCLACKSKRPIFQKGICAMNYAELAARTINRFKRGRRWLSYVLAERMADVFVKELGGSFDRSNAMLVSVPLTEKRQRQRGYNQAEELARRLSELLSIEYVEDVLLKIRETEMQKNLTSEERVANVKGVYHVHKRKECKGKTVVLVDDVMTTGTTGNAIASLLLSAGAKEVVFLVAAATAEKP